MTLDYNKYYDDEDTLFSYHRTEEIFLPIQGFDNFEVSNYGRIRNIRTIRMLKPYKFVGHFKRTNKLGVLKKYTGQYYWAVKIRNNEGILKNLRVHVVVAKTFLGDKSDQALIVMHDDENSLNPYITNLKWGTESENRRSHYEHKRKLAEQQKVAQNGVI